MPSSIKSPASARLRAMLRLRCPRCCRGPIFHGRFAMNERCPVCDLKFEREPGYFLGAMYVSYFLSIPLLLGLLFAWRLLLPDLAWEWLVLVAGVSLVPFAPLLFRYSRGIWIHLERSISPGVSDDGR